MINSSLEFWNERAHLGMVAGTNDLLAKQLEIKAIQQYIKPGMSILDFGCGNGITALTLAQAMDVHIFGVDFSPNMIEYAKLNKNKYNLRGTIEFHLGDQSYLEKMTNKFEIIYTERCIINIKSWEEQKKTIFKLLDLLQEEGMYLMCETSETSLRNINILRKSLDLPKINIPWHNRYLIDHEVEELNPDCATLEEVNNFSSTYYFLSRIINAKLSAQRHEEPRYEDPINMLALQLPPLGDFSQSKIWVWRKKSNYIG